MNTIETAAAAPPAFTTAATPVTAVASATTTIADSDVSRNDEASAVATTISVLFC